MLKEKAENQTLATIHMVSVNSSYINNQRQLLIQMECPTRETSPMPGSVWKKGTTWRVQKCTRSAQMLLSMMECSLIQYPKDHVKLILNRFVKPHIDSGVSEVHIIFDDPKDMLHPKSIEHEYRDQRATPIQHSYLQFNDKMKVPNKWSDLLQCRKCKRCLVVYIAWRLY